MVRKDSIIQNMIKREKKLNDSQRKAMYAKFRELNNKHTSWGSEKDYRKYSTSDEGKKEIIDINKMYLKILKDRKTQGYDIDDRTINHIEKSIRK